jgi:hypothetical protein
MSTYDDASLIYYPSGYKSGKAYSLKPTDGTGDLTFTRASTATRVNEDGLIESVATGVPRIDFTGGGCGKLLLEPQRTNLILHSEDFTNAVWTKISTTISANSTTSPTGAVNASTIVSTIGVSEQYIDIGALSVTSGSSYTLSAFVKKKDYDFFLLRFTGVGGAFVASNAFFNINNGTLGTIDAGIVATITSYGNGWYRCTAKINASATTASGKVRLQLASSDNSSLVVGNGTSGSFIWGADFEAGSYPTSYIPTTTTAVTRVADAAPNTSFLDYDSDFTFFYSSNTRNNLILSKYYDLFLGYLTEYTSPGQNLRIRYSGTNYNMNAVSSYFKLAIVKNSTNVKIFLDGVLQHTITTLPTGLADITLEESQVLSIMVFPTAYSDAAAIALTTL